MNRALNRAPLFAALLAILLTPAPFLSSQSTAPSPVSATDDAASKNAAKARAALDAMVKALGGDAWLNLKNEHREGRIAAFYHGKPSGATSEYYEYHIWPDQDRVEFTTHHDVVQIYNGNQSAEITYKGRAPLPPEIVEEFIRRRNHSLETIVKVWLKNPNTILLYEGQHLAARHLAEQVTVISPDNDSVTIMTDIQTHLPLKRDYQWRDPLYKDKNNESEEYDDYHTVDGIPTPFIVTRFVNDDMVRQKFLYRAFYNQTFPPDTFDIAATEKKIKK
jgi:hypothetical protein